MKTRQRVELRRDPADAEPAISGWATHAPGDDGLSAFALDHEYPDWRPAPGWVLSCGLGAFAVVAADGKALTVREVI